jgi:hypothetical protein
MIENHRKFQRRFICGGYCFWTMPTISQINHDFSESPPPETNTIFEGTDLEAKAAGWELAPRKSKFSWSRENNEIFLCPQCAERVKAEYDD